MVNSRNWKNTISMIQIWNILDKHKSVDSTNNVWQSRYPTNIFIKVLHSNNTIAYLVWGILEFQLGIFKEISINLGRIQLV